MTMRRPHAGAIGIYAALAISTGANGQALTSPQQADLDCLQIARTMAAAQHGSGQTPHAHRMGKFYLARLRRSDPSRDWLAMTPPMPDMPYGEFLGQLQRCEVERQRAMKR